MPIGPRIMSPKIFFVTGICGSGKSTLAQILKKELSTAEVHDFDEGNMPEKADGNWRRQKTDYWLKKIQLHKDKITVICGLCLPKEVKSLSSNRSIGVNYGYICITREEMKRRLVKRGWGPKTINETIVLGRNLEKQVKSDSKVFIVDGEKNEPRELAEKVKVWINKTPSE